MCAYRPEQDNPYRVRWTVGGDLTIYERDVSTKTADLVPAKLTFNSVISTPDARCVMGDLKDFYLGTWMTPEHYAYMRIPVSMLPDSEYNPADICPKVIDGGAKRERLTDQILYFASNFSIAVTKPIKKLQNGQKV